MKSIIIKSLLPFLFGFLILFIPSSIGLEPIAKYYLTIFVIVIIGIITEPIPAAAIGLIGVLISALLLTLKVSEEESIKWALSGFSNPTVWLIFTAFMFALGYQKSGLGKRISLILVAYFGKRTLGLGYAVAFSDLLLAPFMPSNTARSGGTIFPIISRIPSIVEKTEHTNPRAIGAYIFWVALSSTCVTSSMFLTALAPNLLAASIVKELLGIEITWMNWFIYFLPVGLSLIIFLPLFIYLIYPPEIKDCSEISAWASEELHKLGHLSKQEIKMASLALFALLLWVVGKGIINPTTVAILVLCLMVLTSTITWEDIISNKSAWNVLVWFATLVTLAGGLIKLGVTNWMVELVSTFLPKSSPEIMMVIFVIFFYFLHYFFASVTSHVTALLPIFLSLGKSVAGLDILAYTYLLVFSLGIVGIITPYGTGPSPIYYESNYISRKDFWVLGFINGLLFLFVLLIIGIPFLQWIKNV